MGVGKGVVLGVQTSPKLKIKNLIKKKKCGLNLMYIWPQPPSKIFPIYTHGFFIWCIELEFNHQNTFYTIIVMSIILCIIAYAYYYTILLLLFK